MMKKDMGNDLWLGLLMLVDLLAVAPFIAVGLLVCIALKGYLIAESLYDKWADYIIERAERSTNSLE